MTTALDWIEDRGPEHLETFTRLRAQTIVDPYNSEELVDDWSQEPDELPLKGVWASRSSTYRSDATREQLATAKTITVFDSDADIREGDRVRNEVGDVFVVQGRPERDRNPFTGWRPTTVITVDEHRG